MYQLVKGRVLQICLKANNKLEYPMSCLVYVRRDCLMLTYWKMTRNVRGRVCVALSSLPCCATTRSLVLRPEDAGRDDCTTEVLKGRNKMYRCCFGPIDI